MKKVLIITYYWPPAGGSGVQRWLKFTKYLPGYNWQPIIYTPENPYFEVQDEDFLNDIPVEAEIWKTPIWEPYALKDKLFGKGGKSQSAGVISNKNSLKNKALNWLRGNLFIPDPKVYWVKPSIRVLLKKIKEEGIKHIVTTGPPHSIHLIGLGLKKVMPDLKWLADFRDPWSELDLLKEFHLTSFSIRKHKSLEKKVLRTADLTLTVSESWVKDLENLGASRVELITNGYDTDDFDLKSKTNDRFVIGHYGLLNHLRNPGYLWSTLNKMCKDQELFNQKLEIRLAGNIDPTVISEIQSYAFLRNKIKQLGYLSHKEVIQQYNETDVLLLLLFNSRSGTGNYPAKIFEYFAAKKPILAFGPEGSDTQELIQKTASGIYHSYNEKELRKSIDMLYKDEFLYSIKDINKFSRKDLTKELSNLMQQL